MSDSELQIGSSYTLPPNTKIVIKERGVYTPYTMTLHSAEVILHNKGISAGGYKILFKITCDMKPMAGNTVNVSVKELAEYYRTKVSAVYAIIKQLKDADIIRKEKKNTYIINPDIAWSGHTKDRIIAVEQWNIGKTYHKEDDI